jgi:PAS domain S-box-containing protein
MNGSESLQNDQSTATEDALRRAVDTTPAFIHTARPDGYLDYFNRGWLDFLGKSLEDVCGWRWTESVHPDDVAAIVQKWHAALASGEPFEIEARVRRADGSYRALLHRKLPLRDEHGNIVKWFGSSVDIEEKKSAEKRIAEKTNQLERSEFYLREGERLAHMGSWSLRPDGVFDYWSPETFAIFGFDSRNGIPTLKEWLDVLEPTDRDRVHALIRKMFSEGVRGDIQYRLDHAKHGQKSMHSAGEPVLENGKVVRLIGNTLDISEQENVSQELRRREAYLAEAQKLSHTGSFGWDVSSGEIYWSDETFRIFELDRKTKITTELIVQRTHPDDRQAVQQVIECASRDRTEFALEHRLLMPDKSIKYLQVVGRPSTDQGCRSEFVGAVTDITEPKRAEKLLAGEKRVLEMIATAIPLKEILNTLCLIIEEHRQGTLASVLLLNPDGVHLDAIAGPSLPEEWTCQMEKLPIGPCAGSCGTAAYRGSPVMVSDIASDPLWDVPEHRAAALKHGLRASWSNPVLSSQGKVLATFCMYFREVRTPTSKDLELIEFATHQARVAIERDKSEQALRRSEGYLADAQKLSQTGSWAWSPEGGIKYWSEECYHVHGFDPRDGLPKFEELFQRIHPDDRTRLKELMEREVPEKRLFETDYRIVHPSGAVRDIHSTGRPVLSPSGDLIEFMGTVMDVTASKKAFEEIKELRDQLYRENIVLREELGKTSMFEEVIGTSSALQMVLARAAKVAPTDSTVLIMGETGTGKELIARAIHKRSKRSKRPFISVNCAAVPSSLIMSELFGHEKGAFTGAVQRRLGRFELAEGGTLFLDEVGDLPMETQIALLRVLQEREFERVGGTEVLRADVRIISATNRDLQTAIADGAFRSDLYYRLNVFPIKLPPLRERKDDVAPLVNYFVDRYAKRAGKKIKHIQKKALEALEEYSWPGNVRELQNVIERSLIIGETTEFSIDKSWVANEPRSPGSAATVQKANERQRIEAALAQSSGKISGAHGAAAKLGMPPSTLESKIRSLKINKFQFKGV